MPGVPPLPRQRQEGGTGRVRVPADPDPTGGSVRGCRRADEGPGRGAETDAQRTKGGRAHRERKGLCRRREGKAVKVEGGEEETQEKRVASGTGRGAEGGEGRT